MFEIVVRPLLSSSARRFPGRMRTMMVVHDSRIHWLYSIILPRCKTLVYSSIGPKRAGELAQRAPLAP
eukprot:3698102-Prymnesium_polylepis.1